MYDFGKFETASKKIREKLGEELSVLRAGRANPSLVKDMLVDYYGSKVKLEGVATIGVQDARTLAIQPWDKNSMEPIEKAVRASNLGLQPVADKDIIRIILPELTGERRQALLKLAGEKFEEARIALRRSREDIWKEIQEKERAGEISEDEKFRLKDELQKKIDNLNSEFEEIVEKKRKEIGS